MTKDQDNLVKQLNREKRINSFLYSEINELKKINSGLKSAYDEAYKYKEDAMHYQQIVMKYQNYIPYIERFRKSLMFKIIKKVKRKK